MTMTIVYHPTLDRQAHRWPGLESPAAPARSASAWSLWLCMALGLAVLGLMLGQLATVAMGTPPAWVALPFATGGLWMALTVFFYEIGGCDHDEVS